MTEKKNNEGNTPSRTPALDRLFKIPEGFTEKMKLRQDEPKTTPAAAVPQPEAAAKAQPTHHAPQQRRKPAVHKDASAAGEAKPVQTLKPNTNKLKPQATEGDAPQPKQAAQPKQSRPPRQP
ncbi:MAG: hypothetical protein RRY54_05100, partial [Angelakisella sp.]